MNLPRIRPARTPDVRAIRGLIDEYSSDGHLLAKAAVTIFEDIQEFVVVEVDGEVVGCGALHVMWEDLASTNRRCRRDARAVGYRLDDRY